MPTCCAHKTFGRASAGMVELIGPQMATFHYHSASNRTFVAAICASDGACIEKISELVPEATEGDGFTTEAVTLHEIRRLGE